MKILRILLSIFLSFGVSVLIKPYLETYISSTTILYVLLFAFFIVGYCMINSGLEKLFVKKKN